MIIGKERYATFTFTSKHPLNGCTYEGQWIMGDVILIESKH